MPIEFRPPYPSPFCDLIPFDSRPHPPQKPPAVTLFESAQRSTSGIIRRLEFPLSSPPPSHCQVCHRLCCTVHRIIIISTSSSTAQNMQVILARTRAQPSPFPPIRLCNRHPHGPSPCPARFPAFRKRNFPGADAVSPTIDPSGKAGSHDNARSNGKDVGSTNCRRLDILSARTRWKLDVEI